MKRYILITSLLLLHALLFLPCTICTAQTTTITGVVYEKNQCQTTFLTPKGKIKVNLPDDVRQGDVLSGTVVAQPSGKNEKEQKKNLTELLKYKLLLQNGSYIQTASNINLALLNGQVSYNTVPFLVPTDMPMEIQLQTTNNIPFLTAQIPTLPAITTTPSQNLSASFTLAKKVVTNTEPLVILQSGNNSGVPQLVLQNYYNTGKGKELYVLEPLAYSPRKLVYNQPPGLSGMYSVCIQTDDGKIKKIDLVNIVNIDASIGKGKLMKGEQTKLFIEVTGLDGCPYRPVQLEISNKSPSIIQLAQGNQQLFSVDHSNNSIGSARHQQYTTTQNVIGQMIGEFVIHTVLHIPPSAYANTAQAYIDEISNSQQFNRSKDALKADINHYLSSSVAEKNTGNYLQQVRDNLPIVNDTNSLNQAKAQMVNLLNPVCSMPGGNEFFKQLKELNKLHPDIAVQKDVPQFVHPLHDLAGQFDTKTNVLKVNPADQNGLLKYLGAIKMKNGNYSFSLSEGLKTVKYTDVVTRPIDIDPNEPAVCGGGTDELPVPLPGQGGIAGAPVKPQDPTPKEEPKNEVPSSPDPKDTTQKDPPKEESIWPKGEPTTFTDSSGRKYRFYKNAECKLLYSTGNTDCGPQMDYENYNKETGKREPKPTGKYEKWIFQPTKRCLKGNSYCTEMWQITSVQMIYEDKNCETLIETKNWEGFLCK